MTSMISARLLCRSIVVAAVAAAWPASAALAQLPGAPVLQNSFTNPGLTAAVNFASSGDGSAYAGAAAWAPGSGRFQLSGGIGAFKPDGGSSMFSYGLRGSAPLFSFMGGNLGVAPFVGYGAARGDSTTLTYLPAGAGIGLRRALGTSMGFSVFATPFLLWTRGSVTGQDAVSGGPQFRTSIGGDFSFTPKIGVTAGVELGAKAKTGEFGPSGSVFGIGLSYAFR